jgi:hypothetical protein
MIENAFDSLYCKINLELLIDAIIRKKHYWQGSLHRPMSLLGVSVVNAIIKNETAL